MLRWPPNHPPMSSSVFSKAQRRRTQVFLWLYSLTGIVLIHAAVWIPSVRIPAFLLAIAWLVVHTWFITQLLQRPMHTDPPQWMARIFDAVRPRSPHSA